MAKCPVCNKNLIFSMSDNKWMCPSGCDLQGIKIHEDVMLTHTPKTANNSRFMDMSDNGSKLQKASIIYCAIGVIAYLAFAITCFVAGDKMSGYTFLGAIIDVAFYSAIAYVVGGTFNNVNMNCAEIKMSGLREEKNAELLNKCLDKINMQSKCILELTKEIESLKKEINK